MTHLTSERTATPLSWSQTVVVSGFERARVTSCLARMLGLAVAVIVLAVCGSAMPPVVRADETAYLPFYTPPSPLPPGLPGDLIRTNRRGSCSNRRTARSVCRHRNTDHVPQQRRPRTARGGEWHLYRTRRPLAGPRPSPPSRVCGHGLWHGRAVCTVAHVQSGHPASLQTGFDVMFNLEEGWVATLLARGFAIVITDGVGMGVHDSRSPQFLNRNAGRSCTHRRCPRCNEVARHLPGLPRPCRLLGVALQAHTALSAAELAASYGPELHVVGTYAAAAPTDIAAVLPAMDGNFLAGVLGYVLRGIMASYPATEQPIWDALAPRGAEMLANTGRQCLLQTGVDYMFRHIQFWFKQDIFATAAAEPFKSLLSGSADRQRQTHRPGLSDAQPVGSLDPYSAVEQTAADWCAMDADVTLVDE